MTKSIIETIKNARDALLDAANLFMAAKMESLECNQCGEPVTMTLDENITISDFFYTTDVISPPFVRFNIHQECELKAIENSKKKIEQEKREQLAKFKHEVFESYANSIDFPEADKVSMNNVQGLDLIKNWELEDDFGFIIRGPAGTGKSYAAVALAKKIAFEIISRSKLEDFHENVSGSVSVSHSLPVFLKANSFYEKTVSNEYQIPSFCKRARYLFLDDVGTENITDFKREMFYNLIDARSASKLPTFITTNLSLDQIKERFYERVSSRILGMCVPVEVTGEDKRLHAVKDRIQMLKGRIQDSKGKQ